jgi:toxin ParE1/3/4
VKVFWTETALAQLTAAHEFIERTSPGYAQLMVRRVWDRAGQLRDFPQSGRVISESSGREIRELLEQPYRILYDVQPDRVRVLAVIHARRGPEAISEAASGRAT